MTIDLIRTFAIACSVALLGGGILTAQFADKKALTLEGAKRIAAAAEAEASRNNWKVVIAVVDDGGHLLYLERMDEVQTASIEVALEKARSAALYKRPTKAFEERLAGGDTGVLRLPGAAPFEGGLPVLVDGKLVGAIGVSGVASQQDGQIAKAGLNAITPAK